MGKILFLSLGILIIGGLPAYAGDSLDDVRKKYKNFINNNAMNKDEADALIEKLKRGDGYEPGPGVGYNPGDPGRGGGGGGGGGGGRIDDPILIKYY